MQKYYFLFSQRNIQKIIFTLNQLISFVFFIFLIDCVKSQTSNLENVTNINHNSSSIYKNNCSIKPECKYDEKKNSKEKFSSFSNLSLKNDQNKNSKISLLPSDTFLNSIPIFPPDYDSLQPPKNGGPTKVRFHVWVLSIDSIDEGSMTYVADIFMSQTWKDHRLNIPDSIINKTSNYRLLPLSWLNYMWRPDSFFKNAKQVTFQEMTVPNHYLWMYEDKRILYMVKLTLLLSCSMKFQAYPHDIQKCGLKIESLSYTMDDLIFDWEEETPLVVDSHIELPQHNLIDAKLGECHEVYSSGNFTCVEVNFRLKRRLGYYLFHTYIPTCLIVIMSWISFWIKPEAVPARVTLCVTSLLTLSTQHAQSQKSLPPVSYIKAIDIFMSSCTVFVFSSLMEYALVNIFMAADEKNNYDLNNYLQFSYLNQNSSQSDPFSNLDNNTNNEHQNYTTQLNNLKNFNSFLESNRNNINNNNLASQNYNGDYYTNNNLPMSNINSYYFSSDLNCKNNKCGCNINRKKLNKLIKKSSKKKFSKENSINLMKKLNEEKIKCTKHIDENLLSKPENFSQLKNQHSNCIDSLKSELSSSTNSFSDFTDNLSKKIDLEKKFDQSNELNENRKYSQDTSTNCDLDKTNSKNISLNSVITIEGSSTKIKTSNLSFVNGFSKKKSMSKTAKTFTNQNLENKMNSKDTKKNFFQFFDDKNKKDDQPNDVNGRLHSHVFMKRRNRAILVDKISRWTFPLSFIILNIIYWTIYLND